MLFKRLVCLVSVVTIRHSVLVTHAIERSTPSHQVIKSSDVATQHVTRYLDLELLHCTSNIQLTCMHAVTVYKYKTIDSKMYVIP